MRKEEMVEEREMSTFLPPCVSKLPGLAFPGEKSFHRLGEYAQPFYKDPIRQ